MIRVENRTHRRLEMKLSAGVAIVSSILGFLAWKPEFQCRTQDASAQGMKLFSNRPIPEGSDVKLWVSVPNDTRKKALKLRGRVCWAASHDVRGAFLAGVCLASQPARSVTAWKKLIYERVRKDYRDPIPVGVIQ